MVFQYDDFSVLTEYLITYVFGNETVLGIFLYVGFLMYMTLNNVPFGVSVTILTPLIVAYEVAGWLGNTDWLLATALIVVGTIFSISTAELYRR